VDQERSDVRHCLSSYRRRGVRRLRRVSSAPAAGLTMLVGALWAIGALGVAIYMVAALLRPDRF
jgi:K+-transporting ATPase KdpF subunit